MEELIKTIKAFAEILNDIDNVWSELHEKLKQYELESNDLLHEIELTNFNACEGYILAKKLKEVRQRRREVKNKQEILQYVKDFAANNKNLIITLYKLAKSMEEKLDIQQNRVYVPRIRHDLKLAKELHQERLA